MNKYQHLWLIWTNINKHEQLERVQKTSWMGPGPSPARLGILWGILLVYFGVYFWIMAGWSLALGGSITEYKQISPHMNNYEQIWINTNNYKQMFAKINKYQYKYTTINKYKQISINIKQISTNIITYE